jgi:hypothetical protein
MHENSMETLAAQHAHPADRFARETRAILGRDTMRSRRLMRNSLGGNSCNHLPNSTSPFRSIVIAFDCELHMIQDLELPHEIKIFLATALDEVEVHPKHFLHPKTRRALYDLIQSLFPTTAWQIRGWIAFITAQRVLPIFERSLPDERMPRRLLTLAQRVLVGSLPSTSWRVKRYVDVSYHAAGHCWGRDEEEVPYSADVAGSAARKAILEVLGYEPLRNLHYLHVFTGQQSLSGDDLSDLHLASDGQGDTASAAAIAYATEGNNLNAAPQRLSDFWHWWLQEAITQGWKQARNQPLPPNTAL